MEIIATQDTVAALQARMLSAKADVVEAMRALGQCRVEMTRAEEDVKARRRAYLEAQSNLMAAVGIGNDDFNTW